jgi:hypothetical protein
LPLMTSAHRGRPEVMGTPWTSAARRPCSRQSCRNQDRASSMAIVTCVKGSSCPLPACPTFSVVLLPPMCPPLFGRRYHCHCAGSAGRSNRPITVSGERLTDRSVANVVKAYAERASFDANLFSGHTLC